MKNNGFIEILKQDYGIEIDKVFTIKDFSNIKFFVNERFELVALKNRKVLHNFAYSISDILHGNLEVELDKEFLEDGVSYSYVTIDGFVETNVFSRENLLDIMNFKIGNYFLDERHITEDEIKFYQDMFDSSKLIVDLPFEKDDVELEDENLPEIEQHTVNFYVDNELLKTVTIDDGDDLSVDQELTLEKEGYNFLGWFDINDEEIHLNNIMYSVTLYAKFEKIEVYVTYTFLNDENNLIEEVTVLKGEDISPPIFVKEDYHFIAWVDEEGKAVSFTNVTKNTIVIAKVEKILYFATYYFYNENKELIKSITVEVGETIVPPEYNAPSGFEFVEWVYSNDEHVDFENVTEDTNVYVSIVKIPVFYTVNTYDMNDTLIETYQVLEGDTLEVEPYFEHGYNFIGWYDIERENVVSFENVTNNIDAYALVSHEQLMISFYGFYQEPLETVYVDFGSSVNPEDYHMVKELMDQYPEMVEWYDRDYTMQINFDYITENIEAFATTMHGPMNLEEVGESKSE